MSSLDLNQLYPDQVRPPHPHLGWALLWMLAFWGIQIGVSVVFVGGAIIVAVAQGRESPADIETAIGDASVVMIPVGTFFSVLTAITLAWLFYRGQFRERLALRGMFWHQWLTSLLLVLPLAIVASEITNWVAKVVPQFNADILLDFSTYPWPVVFVTACLFPAVGEEILCRGFLGRGLVANHGIVWGVLLASLLFGIMHIDPVQSTGAFVLGIGLHFIYLTTRSLLAPILVHMLNNALAFWLVRNHSELPLPGLSHLPDGSSAHTPVSVLLAAIVTGTALWVVCYQTRTRWTLPDASEWSPGYPTAEQPPSHVPGEATADQPAMWLTAIVLVAYAGLLWALVVSSQAAVS